MTNLTLWGYGLQSPLKLVMACGTSSILGREGISMSYLRISGREAISRLAGPDSELDVVPGIKNNENSTNSESWYTVVHCSSEAITDSIAE